MINLILEARENRYIKTIEKLETSNYTIVCAKLNYPGSVKNNEFTMIAFNYLLKVLEKNFFENIISKSFDEGFDGKAIILEVKLSIEDAKKIAVEIEDKHPLGRIFDIDIYLKNGAPLSRQDLEMPNRRCILCSETAKVCVKTMKHTLEETLEVINKLILDYNDGE